MLNITPYPMRFEGSGKEYFRVWSVNVLLCIVTLSLYTPWARWRTAHYFYGHTFIAGSPLEFTGQKRRMVKGFLAFAALYFAYELASYTEQDTAVNLFMLCGALLTPFMWRSAIRFRVNNTRWRGLRLQFTATLGEVYRYSWPLYVVVAFWAFVYWALMNPSDSLFALPHWTELLFKNKWRALGWLALFLLLSALGLSHVDYNYRRLTVERTTFAGQPSRWKPRYRDFAKIWLYSLVIGAISLAVFIRFNVFVYQWMKEWESAAGTGTDSWWMQALWLLPFWILPFMLVFSAIGTLSFRKAQMFHLVWNQIGIGQIAQLSLQPANAEIRGAVFEEPDADDFHRGLLPPLCTGQRIPHAAGIGDTAPQGPARPARRRAGARAGQRRGGCDCRCAGHGPDQLVSQHHNRSTPLFLSIFIFIFLLCHR